MLVLPSPRPHREYACPCSRLLREDALQFGVPEREGLPDSFDVTMLVVVLAGDTDARVIEHAPDDGFIQFYARLGLWRTALAQAGNPPPTATGLDI